MKKKISRWEEYECFSWLTFDLSLLLILFTWNLKAVSHKFCTNGSNDFPKIDLTSDDCCLSLQRFPQCAFFFYGQRNWIPNYIFCFLRDRRVWLNFCILKREKRWRKTGFLELRGSCLRSLMDVTILVLPDIWVCNFFKINKFVTLNQQIIQKSATDISLETTNLAMPKIIWYFVTTDLGTITPWKAQETN